MHSAGCSPAGGDSGGRAAAATMAALCLSSLPLLAFQLAPRPPVTGTALVRSAPPMMVDPWGSSGGIDMNVVAGVGAALLGIGGGIALIAFTENAGKGNEARTNAQECVECKGEKVIPCTICSGSGVDPLATLVEGVREATGESKARNVVTVEDWDGGPKQVVMYEDILSKYPMKATESVCSNCDGRGVVVCDNCQGTGIQPRFLERYSPDDFMD